MTKKSLEKIENPNFAATFRQSQNDGRLDGLPGRFWLERRTMHTFILRKKTLKMP